MIVTTHIAFLTVLAAASAWDWRTRTIPNAFTLGGLAGALILAPLLPALHHTDRPGRALAAAALGAAAGLAVGMALRLGGGALLRREALGLGDVKLLAFLGAYLGGEGLPPLLLVACTAGAAAGVVRRRGAGEAGLPFAPFLCLGAACRLFAVEGWRVWGWGG